MPRFSKICIAVIAVMIGLITTDKAQAQGPAWPSKPIKMIVTFAAGGGADFVARNIASKMSEYLGQTVVIENRAGGGGLIGNDLVAKAAPDGYTLLMGAAGPLTVAPHLYDKVPYDAQKDLVPVSLVAASPFTLVINTEVPVNNLSQLIELIKKSPGKITYGSSGTGGAPHLAGELFTNMTQLNAVHVPYKGLAPAINDLLGNHVNMLFADTGLVVQQISVGKLKAIAITSAQRSPLLPEVPTMSEAGLPGYLAGSWYGILAPAGTPSNIITRINEVVNLSLKDDELQKKFIMQGLESKAMSPGQFAEIFETDYKKWGLLIKEKGIKLD
jgi:tripartite-type tricarboxylate transporter receptor subunit TctC